MKDSDRIRMGVVGARRGGSFIRQAQALDTVELTAVCDIREELLQQWKEQFPEVQYFTEFEELLSFGTCDAVMIATPPSLHAEQAVRLSARVNTCLPKSSQA